MTIVFDVFGVLMSSGFASSADDLEAVLGLDRETIRTSYVRWEEPFDLGKIDAETFWRNVQADLGTNVDWRTLDRLVLSNYEPNLSAIRLLDACSSRYRTALLSNTRKEWFEHLDHQYELTSRADQSFLSYQLGLKKPDPRIYRHMISEIGASPASIFFLDDREENVDAARREGLRASVFTSTEEAISDLVAHGIQPDPARLAAGESTMVSD
jgi:putative hydrolase of the HAD superfamily